MSDYKKLLANILNDKELVLVSNRGPYSFSYDRNKELVKNRGGGGLVSALLSLLPGH
jgi:trehalose-6-phosphate synthase